MKTIFSESEQQKFIELADQDLMIEVWEEFHPSIPDEDIPFETVYVNYQEKHLLKFGKYLEI